MQCGCLSLRTSGASCPFAVEKSRDFDFFFFSLELHFNTKLMMEINFTRGCCKIIHENAGTIFLLRYARDFINARIFFNASRSNLVKNVIMLKYIGFYLTQRRLESESLNAEEKYHSSFLGFLVEVHVYNEYTPGFLFSRRLILSASWLCN